MSICCNEYFSTKRTRTHIYRYYIEAQPLSVSVHVRQTRIIISRWNGIIWFEVVSPILLSTYLLAYIHIYYEYECVYAYRYAIIVIMLLHRNGRKRRNSLTDFRCIHFVFHHFSLCSLPLSLYPHTNARAHGEQHTNTTYICIWKAYVQSLRFGYLQTV